MASEAQREVREGFSGEVSQKKQLARSLEVSRSFLDVRGVSDAG